MADVTITGLPNLSPSTNTFVPISNGTTTGKAATSSLGGIPIGGIIMWNGTTPPSGWALCNGGNGTPNLVDRFIVSTGGSYGLGATGGLSTVTLSVNEMPNHGHGVTDPGHAHSVPRDNRTPGSIDTFGAGSESGGTSDFSYAFNTAGSGTGISINNAGGSAAHENRPPYYALAFIMRIS